MAPLTPPMDVAGLRTSLTSVVNQKAFSNSSLPLALLLDFVSPSQLNLQRVQRAALRCDTCHAILNKYCKVNFEHAKWQCCMCETINSTSPTALGTSSAATAELLADAVEYAAQTPAHLSSGGALPATSSEAGSQTASSSQAAPHVVVVVDTNMDRSHLANIRKAVPAAIQAELGSDVLVSVVGFDAVLTLWCVSGLDAEEPLSVEAHTLPGNQTMDQASVLSLNASSARYCTVLGAGVDRVQAALGALRPLHTHIPLRDRPRCLMVAIEAGLRLVAASARAQGVAQPARGSRVMVFTSGPTTVGPCSLPVAHLDQVGPAHAAVPHKTLEEARRHLGAMVKMANSLSIPVDVNAVASAEVNVSLLGDLVDPTGGQLTNHPGNSPTLQQAVQDTLSRTWGTAGVLDCYLPKTLKVVQWLGPVSDLQDKIKEGSVPKSLPGTAGASPAACFVSHLCRGQGAAARLELTKDLEEGSFVQAQLVLHYRCSKTGTRVVRVVTRRLRVVTTLAELLQGVDPVAAAVEWSKRLVCDAMGAGAHHLPKAQTAARNACANALTLLGSRFGSQKASGGVLGWGSKRVTVLPAPLVHVAQTLYTLQRGLILGGDLTHVAQGSSLHPEERLLLMRALLCASTDLASALSNPRLYALLPCAPSQVPTDPQPATAPQHRLVPLPALDLSLASVQQAAAQGQLPADSSSVCQLVLDLGTTLVALDCAAATAGADDAQLQAVAEGHAAAVSAALSEEALPVHVFSRSPVPGVISAHALQTLKGHVQLLVQGSVSSVTLDSPVWRQAEFMQAGLSAAHLTLGQYNTVVSKGALPAVYDTAIKLAEGKEEGPWKLKAPAKPNTVPASQVSFLAWCAQFGLAPAMTE